MRCEEERYHHCTTTIAHKSTEAGRISHCEEGGRKVRPTFPVVGVGMSNNKGGEANQGKRARRIITADAKAGPRHPGRQEKRRGSELSTEQGEGMMMMKMVIIMIQQKDRWNRSTTLEEKPRQRGRIG